MLHVAASLNGLSFERLMHVYQDANRKNGAVLAPFEPPERQKQLAEQDFYDYLHDLFFTVPGARYAVWVESDAYYSALRLEPYRDGLLVEALETAPECRQKGYATKLLRSVQNYLGTQGIVRLYSHVGKYNKSSLKTHWKCGFQIIADSAVYIDGSVTTRAFTMKYEKNSKSS